jgi:ABC-type transport system substrate-binding protein
MTEDMLSYTFYLEEATFSDGSRLTAGDVLASMLAAMESPVYGGRFTHVEEVTVTENGGVNFRLDTACENLPILLDIPIVKAEDVDATHPRGTGPYEFAQGLSGAYLRKVLSWWVGKEIVAFDDSIDLVECTDEAMTRDEFQFGEVGVVCTNPLSDNYAEYRCDYELWDVDSGMFLYLGCNVLYSDYFDDGVLRQILTYAIDRATINAQFYHGHAQEATLAAPPSSPHYSQSLAEKYEFDSMKFIDEISGWTIPKDKDNPDRKLRLLVNCDDSARLRTARYIAAALTEFGIPCGTLEYGAATKPTYETVLRANTFDIYLGQTRLSPNNDLSEFFRLWGNLSWGGIPNDNILKMCKDTLENSGNYYNLLELVAEDGRIIPILFGTYAIYAQRGLLPDLAPSRDNVFYYSLGKTMEACQIQEEYE